MVTRSFSVLVGLSLCTWGLCASSCQNVAARPIPIKSFSTKPRIAKEPSGPSPKQTSHPENRNSRSDASQEIAQNVEAQARINVRDFGARGDGSTDDSVAVQAAVNSVSSDFMLVFPPGEYLLNSPIQFDGKTHFSVHMEGTARANSLTPAFQIGSSAAFVMKNCQNFTITPKFRIKSIGDRGVAIELTDCAFGKIGNGIIDLIRPDENWNGTFLVLRRNVTDLVVSGNNVRCGWGVLTNNEGGISRITIDGNTFRGNISSDLIEINEPAYGASHISVSNNILTNTSDSLTGSIGVGMARVSHATITGNSCSNLGHDGIHVEDRSEYITIVGNIIQRCRGRGISITGQCKKVTVSNNTILHDTGSNKVGINVDGTSGKECEDIILTNNQVDGTSGGITDYGLLILFTKGAVVSNNLFQRSKRGAFINSSLGGNTIEKNTFKGCQAVGLEIGGLTNPTTIIADNKYVENMSSDFIDQASGELYRVIEYRDSLPFGRKSRYRAGAIIETNKGKVYSNWRWINVRDGYDGIWRRIGEVYSNVEPTSGYWDVGEKIYFVSPTSGGYIGRVCIRRGTSGNYTEGLIASGSGTSTVTLNGTSNILRTGDIINVGSTTDAQILEIDSSKLLLDKTVPFGSGLTISYQNPIFKLFGAISL